MAISFFHVLEQLGDLPPLEAQVRHGELPILLIELESQLIALFDHLVGLTNPALKPNTISPGCHTEQIGTQALTLANTMARSASGFEKEGAV